MEFLKKHKQALTVLLSVVIVAYAAFLFVLPNVINLNNYKKDIQKIVFDNAKLNFDSSDIKIVTTPSLKAGVKLENAKVSYPDNRDIFSAKSVEVKIALLPLVLKNLRVSDITVEKPQVSLIYLKDGQIDIVEYLTKKLPHQEAAPDAAAAELPVKISDKLPKVVVKDYIISLKDEKTANKLELKGDNFILEDSVINKHINLSTVGKLLVNGSENVSYDVSLYSFWPAMTASNEPQQEIVVPQIDFINEIVKYDPKADIKADLKIKEHKGHVDLFGDFNAEKISVKLDGKRLPDSYLRFKSTGHKTVVDSNLYVSDNEKAQISADLKQGRNTELDLKVKTDEISFFSLQKFASALLNSMNVENDIASFVVNGGLSADFNLKTDLKDFESNGYLKVLNGTIKHKSIPVKISDISAEIDFSNNNVNIKKAGVLINGSPLSAKGSINSKAVADIGISSEKINIAPLFNAFAPVDVKKAYLLNSGILELNVLVKGKLEDIEPNINVSLDGLSLQDRAKTFVLTNHSTLVNIKTKGSSKGMSFIGEVALKDSALNMHNPRVLLSAPVAKVKITTDDITVVPFTVTMNSSKINVSGSIKNYMKKMRIDLGVDGTIKSNDLKNLLPNEVKSFVGAKGVIPIMAAITGNDKKIEVNAQAYSDSQNYFAPVTIKNMSGKSGLLNLSLVYSDDNISLSDASLYKSNKNNFSEDYGYNKKGGQKIAGLSGFVNNVSSSYPALKLDFSIPQSVLISSSAMPNASLKAKGDVNIFGTVAVPLFKGFITIKDINLPDMLTKVQDVDLELNDETVTAKVQNLDINGTSMNIDAEASTKFVNVFLIRTMKITCANFDVDKLFAAMDKMNKLMPAPAPKQNSGKSTASKGPVVPVKISNGTIDIQKLKMKQAGGDFIATAINGNFNLSNDLFVLENLNASVFNGTVTGKVTYNLATTAVTAIVNGKGLNANPVVTVFAGLKDQMMANVDFNANVRLKGATYEQQMKSLNGKVSFSSKDGQMGSLGRLETFLKADNLISQGFVVTKIGSLINTIAPYNTGKFAYLNGDLNIVNGVAKLNPVKMSGPHMSLLITGDVNILSMISSLQVMGSLSPEVVSALGPVADLSVEKFAAYIPKFGSAIAAALNKFNAAANQSELDKIPALSPSKTGTKSFKVILNGNLNNPTSTVKRFQWLNTPEKLEAEQKSLLETLSPSLSIPSNKEELKQQLKEDIQNQLDNNEKIQELKQNKAVKTLGSIYQFYKDKSTDTTTKE